MIDPNEIEAAEAARLAQVQPTSILTDINKWLNVASTPVANPWPTTFGKLTGR